MLRFWIVVAIILVAYGAWRRLRSSARRAALRAGGPEQALWLSLRLSAGESGDETSSIVALEEAIESALRRDGTGELEGHDLRDGVWTLYLYGPDARRIFESVAEPVRRAPLAGDSHAVLRFGGLGAQEERVPL